MSPLVLGVETPILDEVVLEAWLGVRFFDVASGRFIDDLSASARPAVRPTGPTLPLGANRSGVFVLHTGAPNTDYVLTVSDPVGRFLPFTTHVFAPAHGLAVWQPGAAASPPQSICGEPAGAIPLFSAPGRLTPGGLARVYASLFDPLANAPAAGAILEISDADRVLGRGLSDARGQVLVVLPYPPPVGSLTGSPPSPPAGGPAAARTWTVSPQVAYSPRRAVVPAGGVPDLGAALEQLHDRPATAWADSALHVPLGEATLVFGEDLVLRTLGTSHVLVTAAGSPP